MPQKDHTSVLVILDRSGSMDTIRASVENGLRQVAKEQAQALGTCEFDLVSFSSDRTYDEQATPASSFSPRLYPGGMTALYDAIVWGVNKFRERLDGLPDAQRPQYVQVIVATDGEENSSEFADAVLVRDTIQFHTDNYGWDFTFLGSNQDAVLAGALMGFEGKKSMTFASTSKGVAGATSALSDYIAQTRSGKDAGYDDSHRKAAVGA